MNMSKKILIGLILVSIHAIIWDLLKLLDIIAMTDSNAKMSNILFTMSVVIALGALFKHKYWILACFFSGLNRIARIASAFLFKSFMSTDNVQTKLIMIIGIIFSLISLYYFYKLYMLKDFSFSKHLRFKD